MPVSLYQATPADLSHARKEGVVIVDRRRPDEWVQTGVIESAKTITASEISCGLNPEFQQKFMALVQLPDKPILLYCRTGSRTTHLGTALAEQLGFSQMTHLSAGILGGIIDGYKTMPFKPEFYNNWQNSQPLLIEIDQHSLPWRFNRALLTTVCFHNDDGLN